MRVDCCIYTYTFMYGAGALYTDCFSDETKQHSIICHTHLRHQKKEKNFSE